MDSGAGTDQHPRPRGRQARPARQRLPRCARASSQSADRHRLEPPAAERRRAGRLQETYRPLWTLHVAIRGGGVRHERGPGAARPCPALAAKSLLVADHGQYRLLDVIRAFGARQLEAVGEVDIVTERLVESFHESLAPHEFAFMVPGPVLAELDRQWQNLVTVTGWAAARGDARHGLLAYALGSSWLARGDLHEARRTLERAPESGIALNQLSVVLSALGDYQTALEVSDRASRSAPPGVLRRCAARQGHGIALSGVSRRGEGMSPAEPGDPAHDRRTVRTRHVSEQHRMGGPGMGRERPAPRHCSTKG